MISIIIPIYNAEKYLGKCVESLLAQSYADIEVVCVDDGSKDASLQLLNEYKQADRRIKIVTQTNSGASGARNTGLDNCTGDYIMFIDSDDWIDKETCETALATAEKTGADVVMWDYLRELPGKAIPKNIFDTDMVFDRCEIENKLRRRMIGLLNEELVDPTSADSLSPVWGKLYRASVIKKSNARFYDIKKTGSHEDGLFNLDVFSEVKSAVYIHKFFNHYRKTNEESITTKYNPKYKAQREHLYDYMESYIKENHLGEEYTRALENRIALEVLNLGLNIFASKERPIRTLKDTLKESRYRDSLKKLDLTHFPVHWKLFYLCAKTNFTPGLYVLLKAIHFLKKLV